VFVLDQFVFQFDDSSDEGGEVQALEIMFKISEEETGAVFVSDAHAVDVYHFLAHILFEVENIDGGVDVGLHLLIVGREEVAYIFSDYAMVDV
jgi:hypothetical protein